MRVPPESSDSPPPPPTDENDIIELELTDLAYGGDAVGRYQGRAVFVTGGLPGERVRARLTRERNNYARGVVVEIVRASPDRVAAPYPEMGASGGFQWQHLAYPAQLQWKSRIVAQLLTRIGHFTTPVVHPTLGAPADINSWQYRTVAQFAIGRNGAIGFKRMGSHDVLDMPTCPLVHPALDTFYQQVRGWMQSTWGVSAAEYAERFTLRVAFGGLPSASDPIALEGVGMAAGLLTIEARPASAFTQEDTLRETAQALMEVAPGLVGVVILGLPGGRGRIVVGREQVYERVLHRTFRISAGSFFQVNAAQTPVLARQALAAASPQATDWALDGYSGAGLFSLFLAEHVQHVHAIESQPSAVADARASAILNNISNVTVTEGLLERALGHARKQRERADVALVDPPRSGCHPRALAEIRALGPRNFVYISCDPSTLARDLALFCAEEYRLSYVQPVDMFPHTSHIECVALCERIGGASRP